MDDADGPDPQDSQDPHRRPWREGPEDGTPVESWLSLNDDDLLLKIETIGSQHDADERLLEVVASDRHFFIRQEAAKRVRRKKALFPYEDDRHIGQILVRHLNRREDLTYLERMSTRGTHHEVRKAAHVQMARLRKRLEDQDRRDATRQAQGKDPWRVLVVHADPRVRGIVGDTLPSPEYQVSSYDTGGAAVGAIRALDPHLVLAGIDEIEGAGFHAAIRNHERPLPVVVLCDVAAAARLPEVVGKLAEDFMLLPLQPGLLAGKTRALLHLAHLAPLRSERRKASGPVGEEGVLPLLMLCEQEQLTCRLVVSTDGARYFADFVAGEMTEAGGVPSVADDEALAAILAVRGGTYEMIEAVPLKENQEAEEIEITIPQGVVASASAPASATAATAAATPATATRTDGKGWQVPDVDATLLGWAVHFIVEQAWAHLGTAATAGLLRRTLQDGLERHPVLKVFSVEENAHVGVDVSRGARLPADAVGVTAQWMAVFLAAARRIAPDAASIDVRTATQLVGAALEHVDFYAAYERAADKCNVRPPSLVIGKITPTGRPR
jgi:CheY-like chemotaxis protein